MFVKEVTVQENVMKWDTGMLSKKRSYRIKATIVGYAWGGFFGRTEYTNVHTIMQGFESTMKTVLRVGGGDFSDPKLYKVKLEWDTPVGTSYQAHLDLLAWDDKEDGDIRHLFAPEEWLDKIAMTY